VSPERDDPIDDQDHELYDDVPPRSIFAATWFRVVLVVIVLGVVGAVAVPYVLDWMNPPPAARAASSTRSPMTSAPLAPPTSPAAEKPATDKLLADRASSDRPVAEKPVAEKKDPMGVPAPAPMTAAPATPSAKPSAEPRSAAAEAKAEAKRLAPADAKGQSAMAVTEKPPTRPSATKPSVAARPEAMLKTAAAQPTPKHIVAKATTPAPTAGGPYWVQIGAFKDAQTAQRVAAKLREENFKVEESLKRVGGAASAAGAPAAPTLRPPSAPTGTADQYDVFVSGMSVEELNRRLAGKGLAGESSSGGVVVKPSLPLRDAVALSKDLAVDGFRVQVRRSGAAATAPAVVSTPAPSSTSGQAGQTLHRVRVGAFTDRTAALAAARELENKGFKPYIARGD
jgi:cell division protein FtsN